MYRGIFTISLLFLILFVSSPIASFSATDFDRDGVPDDGDSCPKLQEDYQGTIDGCPSNFVPWYDEDFDGIEDHIDK